MKDIFERDMAGEPVSIDENIIAVDSPAGASSLYRRSKQDLREKKRLRRGGCPAGPPGAARRGGRRPPAPAKPGRPAGRSHPPAKTRGEEKPPPAASEKPFDRRGKLR